MLEICHDETVIVSFTQNVCINLVKIVSWIFVSSLVPACGVSLAKMRLLIPYKLRFREQYFGEFHISLLHFHYIAWVSKWKQDILSIGIDKMWDGVE